VWGRMHARDVDLRSRRVENLVVIWKECKYLSLAQKLGASVDEVKNRRQLLEVEHPFGASDEVLPPTGWCLNRRDGARTDNWPDPRVETAQRQPRTYTCLFLLGVGRLHSDRPLRERTARIGAAKDLWDASSECKRGSVF
jgi:hypothetical protein